MAITWQPTLRAQALAPVPDPKGVLVKARAAYYDLSARGFKQYRFQATPAWAMLLGDLQTTNPTGFEAAMKLFAKVRFDVAVDAAGSAHISHNEVETPNEQTRAGMTQVFSGMDQMLSGFFQTWSPFMISNPFAKVGSNLRVEDTGTHYRVQWLEANDTKVDILMDRTYAVTEMKVKTPAFDSILLPSFDHQPGGLVLTRYEADYREKAPAPAIRVVVLIKNKPIQGLLLPSDLDLTARIGENTTHILMAFTDALIEKKEP